MMSIAIRPACHLCAVRLAPMSNASLPLDDEDHRFRASELGFGVQEGQTAGL